jgi:poly-gamma-glutamate capsule biosynthesis protein CapA/YwtB (metallophosphatase superfamily)
MSSRRAFLWASAATLVCVHKTGRQSGTPARLPAVRLVFGGDAMLARYVGKLARARRDPAWPWRQVAARFASADIACVNLESPFSDRPLGSAANMIFRAEPEMIEGLVAAGVDVVSTANNHARDCGADGIKFTLDWLRQHGIAAVGTGRNQEQAHAGAVVARAGTRFGFLAYTYDQSNGNYRDADTSVAVMDVKRMREDVGRLGARADVIVVLMHAGNEYSPHPEFRQREFARAAIDAGAKLVVGHHPHVEQEAERYGGGAILYSLGNFIFDQFQRAETQRGLVAEAVFRGRRLEQLRLDAIQIRATVPAFLSRG